jgi:hypothetical protein
MMERVNSTMIHYKNFCNVTMYPQYNNNIKTDSKHRHTDTDTYTHTHTHTHTHTSPWKDENK